MFKVFKFFMSTNFVYCYYKISVVEKVLCLVCVRNKLSLRMEGKMKFYALRLVPGSDLKNELIDFVNKNEIESGVIVTCVGSLQKAKLRLSDLSIFRKDESFEIVSLVGTLCKDGLHLHISISDYTGKTFGGHLLDGNIIHTTAEIVIGVCDEFYFKRKFDEKTGFKELSIL